MSDSNDSGSAQRNQGITLIAFVTALNVSLIVFGVQTGLFLVLRNKLSRIFKPKTYLVPERERTEPPPGSPWGLVSTLLRFRDREIIKKCGLDAYFFLRYLQTLLVIFVPMAVVIIPILVPVNYVGGISRNFSSNQTETGTNSTDPNGIDYSDPSAPKSNITGLDTLAWGNVRKDETNRYWAHLVLAVLVIIWVCGVFFSELRVYIKVRQDWLTTAEHRLRASATTVLVSGIPDKWLSEEALRGLFDVFPGGLRNVWLTRDLTHLLDKISKRDQIHKQLEGALTELIRMAKKAQLKKREEDEKRARKASKSHRPTKEEKIERQQKEDTAAKIQAEGGQGVSSGDRHEVPHDVTDAEAEVEAESQHDPAQPTAGHGILSTGISKFTGGIGKGVDVVGKTGQGIFGGAKNITHGIDNQIETTGGFVTIGPSRGPSSAPPSRGSDRRHVRLPDEKDLPRPSQNLDQPGDIGSEERVMGTPITRALHSHNNSTVSQDTMLKRESVEMRYLGNTTRKATNLEETQEYERVRWYQFWKPPEGAYASPLPQGYDGDDFPFKDKKEKTFWEKVKPAIPFVGGEELEPVEYPKAYDEDWKEDHDTGAEWEKWIKKSKRPTHRLAIFEWTPSWLPGLPLLNKKTDTIYWCRQELARLNLEIETDQKNPERYPLMKSAFIQFNHQVAAHMACQSVTHHIPRHMAPRTVEISPDDVLWENMAMSWWSEWLRTAAAVGVVVGMIILWAFPVAFTSSISQVSTLTDTFPWLSFIDKNDNIHNIVSGVAGVLPAILLALLLWLVPIIMGLLASFKGAKTGAQKSETIQKFYFAFLFVQVFLVVSLATGLLQTLDYLANNPTQIADLLAENLPKAANYFFSYMILQALSVSSGTLLQIGSLIKWYIISKIMNSTARNKWSTNTELPEVNWGTTFPVYTNFACIALIYSVVAPIISLFAIITFSLLWMANRYSMLYVNRLRIDTGGVLYPQAINQTFTGLYVMELCLVGLFFLVRNENGEVACVPQAIIMIVAIVLTALYQLLLNRSFGPLFRYLPITFEDEAVLRDEAFQRAQDRRLGLVDDGDGETYDKEDVPNDDHGDGLSSLMDGGDDRTGRGNKFTNFKPVKGIVHASTWAARGGKNTYDRTFGKAEKGLKNVNKFREERRQKDLEAQRAIGEALYGGFHDEIEDLTPEERDVLVRRAFMHSALRARRPTVWIPRDDIGVSDDEIKRTKEFSEHIWISNEGTALDSKVRVVYGRAPPDFSELDIISL
ncbi:DUF221-domain-containing protein [Hypoxylon rubiginosum]|uniref:DUF221-domain-containing protein n=1 Tax=Hypoxylon rubiginosum TaxID=110542 RepID=A0ACB9ZEH7_9PEZI|nr:DUF221-domain-containing protein [Hypoxylon rubiginosum]